MKKKKKLSWFLISILVGAFGGIISYFYIYDIKLSLLISLAIAVLIFINNPKRRYIKIFWSILASFLILNKLSIDLFVDYFGVKLYISNQTNIIISILLFILCLTALLLDYLERKEIKLKNFKNRKSVFKRNKNVYYSEGDITIKKNEE